MSYIFIINPVSGKGKGLSVGKIIDEYCKNKGINYRVVYTDRKRDAEYLAALYKNVKNNVIYSVGGDGTLNEVVNGMANSESSLGIIPIGSGNDFYRSLIDNRFRKS